MSWQKVKLGDLCTIEKGKTGIQKAVPGEFPLVVTAEERKSHNEYQFDDEAVIIPLVSGTGHGHASIKRLHFQSGKFALGSILSAVIPKDKSILNAEYLYRFLNLNKERELVDKMKGMANVTLPIKEIAKIEIPLPSLEEQIEFVEKYALLETDSEDISFELAHQLDLIKQLRQAFLREAMQGKLVKSTNTKETGQQLLNKIKAEKAQLIADKKLKKEKELPPITADEIPFEIPDHWAWCRLGEICQFNPRNKADDNLDVGFCPMPLIYSDYKRNVDFEIRKWKSVKSGFTHFANNDVVFGKITPCFQNSKAAIINNLPNGIGAGTTELYVLRGFKGVNSGYIYNFIKDSNFLIEGERLMRGVAGQQRVPREFVENSIIPIPPLHEQEQIVAKLEELMAFCEDLEQSIKESQGYNEKLLQQVLREALQGKEKV